MNTQHTHCPADCEGGYHQIPEDTFDLLTGEHRQRMLFVRCRSCEHSALADEADAALDLAETAPAWTPGDEDMDALAAYFEGFAPEVDEAALRGAA